MSQETTFRAPLLAGFVIVVAITLYHRVRAHGAGEPLDRRQEGLGILVTLRLAGLLLWAGVIACLIAPRWMAWSSVPLPAPVRWTGIALCFVAAGLLVWTLGNLGKNLTDTVVTRRAHTLATGGPYRWVRHPFYGCVTLLIAGIALAMANAFVLAAGVVLVALLVARTRVEEEKLVERVGDDYRAYMERTGRFLPRPRSGRSGS